MILSTLNYKTLKRLSSTVNYFLRNIQSVGLNDIPKTTLFDIKKNLKSKGFAICDGQTCISIKCPICLSENKTEGSHLFINKTTGFGICPTCNTHGDWIVLESFLRKKQDSAIKERLNKFRVKQENFSKEWQEICNSTLSISSIKNDEVEQLFQLYEYPYKNESCKVLSHVRVSNDHTVLYYPLKNNLETVVGYRKVQAGKEDEAENHGFHVAGLFWGQVAKAGRSEQAVIISNIQDLLHLAAHKIPGALIWLSNGSLHPAVLPALESCKRIYLWGEWSQMRAVAEKLGEDRSLFVRPTNGCVTATEAAKANLSLKSLVSEAKPASHQSITTFSSLREDVYAEITNIDKVRGVRWRRFPGLGRVLGGHRRGELTVLTGPTGCGKTTLCAEMSLDLAMQGVTTLWGSFEIRNSRLARTMLQQFAGVPLEEHLEDFHAYADEFQKLPIFYLAFHGQQPLKVVMEAVEHARYVHDVAHVVIDNVQFVLGSGERDADRYARQDALIAAFRTFATARHTHVTLVMHPRKERDSEDLSTSSIFGSAKASQEADNVLIIQDKRLTAVRGKQFLQVAKNRYSGDLGIIPLEFDKKSLSFQTKKKPKVKQEDPEKLLNKYMEEFTIDDKNFEADNHKTANSNQVLLDTKTKPSSNSYLNEVLGFDTTR